MIQIIPIKERDEKTVDTDKIFFIPNEIKNGDETIKLNSMAEKYNYAINNIILKQDDELVCFRHFDTEIRTPLDICEYKLNNLFTDKKVGIAGLIGTIMLENSCTWWAPNRDMIFSGSINGSGAIIQGGVRAKTDENGNKVLDENGKEIPELFEYPMNDQPGVHDYLATVDGCCLFFPKRTFDAGFRFDETLKEYHFYDCDICLQLLEKGYKVSTIDIVVKHQSSGIPSPNFRELGQVFFNKWNKKVHGEWPISRLSKFYNDDEQQADNK